MGRLAAVRAPLIGALAGALAAGACSHPAPAPDRYRLGAQDEAWQVGSESPFFEELTATYPEFFEVILEPSRSHLPDMRPLRDDLEKAPVDARNYRALHALAIAYFELNGRAQSDLGGDRYFADSTRAVKIMAVPWRAYMEIQDPALRDAILDFFADIASGEKTRSGETAARLVRTVESLERREPDPVRRARIRAVAAALGAWAAPPP